MMLKKVPTSAKNQRPIICCRIWRSPSLRDSARKRSTLADHVRQEGLPDPDQACDDREDDHQPDLDEEQPEVALPTRQEVVEDELDEDRIDDADADRDEDQDRDPC